jgi:hypothetical protein
MTPTMRLIKEKEVVIKSIIRKLQIQVLPECELEDMLRTYFNMKT